MSDHLSGGSRALSMTPNAVQKRDKRLKAGEARTVAQHIAKQTGHNPEVLFHLIAAMRADGGDKIEAALAAVVSHMGLAADELPFICLLYLERLTAAFMAELNKMEGS
jgi:hypothetical protein